jgi:D-aminoacyl-tRNA deacylase
MRLVIQRVSSACLRVQDTAVARIGTGLLVLLGVEQADTPEDIEWLSTKLVKLRIFDDEQGAMNRSILDVGGEILLVSQFTLHASTRKGTRPSWNRAAPPEIARPLYEDFHRRVQQLLGRPVPTGVFGAHMRIELINDGPVTLIVDSRLRE